MPRYHTTPEQSRLLTQVGAGTPMGEVLRKYWWPVAVSADLRRKPTMVRLLGQDLVLFRDAQGRLGLLDAKCPHRRAPLCLGSVTADGVRCRYHGWLLDKTGKVLEAPGEPGGSSLKDEVRHGAYPVVEAGGLIFAYLGRDTPPDPPRYHMLLADGDRNVGIQGFNDCNWLQCAENGIDAHHVSFLHGDVWTVLSPEPDYTWYEEHPLGVVLRTVGKGRAEGEYAYREHPLLLPGISVGGDNVTNYGEEPDPGHYPATTARWTVPIDDTHTVNFRIWYRPAGKKKSELEVRTHSAQALKVEPYKEYKEGSKELGYDLESAIYEQDASMFDGMGHIVDRENENLSEIDDGVILLRKMLLKQIEVVKAGQDPIGVTRTGTQDMVFATGSYQWVNAEQKAELLGARKAEPAVA